MNRTFRSLRGCAPVLILFAAVLALSAAAAHGEDSTQRYSRRWVFCMHNMLPVEQTDALIGIIERAGKAGYNGVVLTDFKFNILERMPKNYFRNVQRVKDAAARAGLEIIPALFPIGNSDGLLYHDPNLAEGMPVRDATFFVKGRSAALEPDPTTRLLNGGFEQIRRGDQFTGFSYQDDPGVVTFADRTVVHGGKVSCRAQDFKKGKNGVARVIQQVSVRPHACYRLSCWVKTKDLVPAGLKLLALGESGRSLTFHESHMKPTQDWTQLEAVFNSQDNTKVTVYAGQWGGRDGMFWLDDFALQEIGLVNVLRREGCPFVVASDDGKTVYEEGKDYLPVADSKLGDDPHHGTFGFNHPAPALTLTEKSRIRDGERLRVSWYHPVVVHGEQVMCCLTEPKVYALLRDQARRVNELFHPRTIFMSHDEFRVGNWCRTCASTGKTPGRLMAENAKRCIATLKEFNPDAKIVVWSDMFDPFHNAVDDYYLVNGTLKGSWEGLPSDVIIANWNSGKAAKSLKWFADRGHPQILAGYYDADASTFNSWDQAARGVPKVAGFMYTTWEANYGDLEAYSAAMLGGK